MWTGIQVLDIKKSLKLKEWGSAHRIIYVGNASSCGTLLRKKTNHLEKKKKA